MYTFKCSGILKFMVAIKILHMTWKFIYILLFVFMFFHYQPCQTICNKCIVYTFEYSSFMSLHMFHYYCFYNNYYIVMEHKHNFLILYWRKSIKVLIIVVITCMLTIWLLLMIRSYENSVNTYLKSSTVKYYCYSNINVSMYLKIFSVSWIYCFSYKIYLISIFSFVNFNRIWFQVYLVFWTWRIAL